MSNGIVTTKKKVYWCSELHGTLFPWSCAILRKDCRVHAIDGFDSGDFRNVKYVRVNITKIKRKKPRLK